MITARELENINFPKKDWPIEEILPEGLALLVGKPKVGKSSLALSLAVKISGGEFVFKNYKTKKGRVLYITFEEEPELIQERLKMQDQGFPPRLKIFALTSQPKTNWTEEINKLLTKFKNTRLVVIDMLKHIRPPKAKGISSYQDDSEFIANLKNIADQFKVAILLLHHERKMKSEDQLDTVLGTTGITGSADVIWTLERKVNQSRGILKIVGRRVKGMDLELKFIARRSLWVYEKGSNKTKLGPGQKEIYLKLKRSPNPLYPKELADLTGKKSNNVVKLLTVLINKGKVRKNKRGRYRIPGVHSVHKEKKAA